MRVRSNMAANRGLSDQIWVVTVPNGPEADQTTLASLAKSTQDRGLCRLHKFEVPSLHHGTLDSLIALSDDLGKMNQQVEVSRGLDGFLHPRPVFARHLAHTAAFALGGLYGRDRSRRTGLSTCAPSLDLEINPTCPSFFLPP